MKDPKLNLIPQIYNKSPHLSHKKAKIKLIIAQYTIFFSKNLSVRNKLIYSRQFCQYNWKLICNLKMPPSLSELTPY